MSKYHDFIQRKTSEGADTGIEPLFIPISLFGFQRDLVQWSLRKGRAAVFADCGLGKTPIQLTWAENITRHTGKPVLILTPLAVSAQTVREGDKFCIECARSNRGERKAQIVITNYERLHFFSPDDYSGVVCDESSILKSFDGSRRQEITEFMRKVPYRLLATATAAPNDYLELGTSSEALGYLGHMDMLARFFKNDNNNLTSRRMYGEAPKWRFKGHAEIPFWRWVSSWARAVRAPSDLGFPDGDFILPPLIENEVLVDSPVKQGAGLFTFAAANLHEQREERKRTIVERCEEVARRVSGTGKPALVWCHLNAEGDLLEDIIPGAVQIAGADSDEKKEERFAGFASGEIRVLVTKPKIGAWGLNFQHCDHITYFPSHSFEQYYQAVRRCWRFGQKSPVTVDVVLTEGDKKVMANMVRKAEAAKVMFSNLVREMQSAEGIASINQYTQPIKVPSWLSKSK